MHNCVNLAAGLMLLAALILNGCGGQQAFQPSPPPPPSPTVQLSVSENGSGTVTSSPGGINCGSTCTETFDAGTSVTLLPYLHLATHSLAGPEPAPDLPEPATLF